MGNRKLGRPTNQRKALLRNQVTNLIWYGKIETTLDRAKEVRSSAERLITVAIRECDNTVEVKKLKHSRKNCSKRFTCRIQLFLQIMKRGLSGRITTDRMTYQKSHRRLQMI